MRKRPEPVPAPRGSPATPPRPGGLAAAWTHLWGAGPVGDRAGPWGTGWGRGGGAWPLPALPQDRGSSGSSCSSERFRSLVSRELCTFTEASFRCVYSPCRIEDIPPPTKKLSPELTPSVLFTGFEPVQVQQYVKVTCQPRVACFSLAVTEPTPDGGACRDRLRGAVVTCLGRRRVSCPQVTRFLAVAE